MALDDIERRLPRLDTRIHAYTPRRRLPNASFHMRRPCSLARVLGAITAGTNLQIGPCVYALTYLLNGQVHHVCAPNYLAQR